MKNIPSLETAPAEQIREAQLKRVRQTVEYVITRSPFYRKLFSGREVETWDDFEKLPTTSKDDLQNNNLDFLCVDHNRIAEYTSTSGTLGKPVTIALSEADLQRLAYNECISFACADGSADDLYQLMLTLDRQFMAGIAYYEGIRKLGAGLIRVGPGLPSMQWETIQRLKPNTLVAVPSFITKLIDYAIANDIDPNSSSVKKAICIGEGVRADTFELNALGKKIIDQWNIGLFSTYASTEMQTAFTECNQGRGGHLHPELIYLEILDEEGNVVHDGRPGEITITTFGVEAMPLVRYRTGDIASLHDEACACGRNTSRIGPIVGRKQQMIKLKGTTLYPSAIFDLLQARGISDYVVEAFTGILETDEVRIYLSAEGNNTNDIGRDLISNFQSRLRVVPEFVIVTANEIERLQHSGGTRKIKKFIDNRK